MFKVYLKYEPTIAPSLVDGFGENKNSGKALGRSMKILDEGLPEMQ